VARSVLVAALLAVLAVEGLFLRSYLPTVREAVEKDGAVMLVLGTCAFFLALWLPTTRVRPRFFLMGALLACAGLLLFLAYVLMTRW